MTQTEDGRRILEAGPDDADATLILMHGLGADAEDLAPVAQYLNLPDTLRLRVVLPDAPERPITINGGMRTRAPGTTSIPPPASIPVARTSRPPQASPASSSSASGHAASRPSASSWAVSPRAA